MFFGRDIRNIWFSHGGEFYSVICSSMILLMCKWYFLLSCDLCSALDIEGHLLIHPHVVECAVVGIADLEWGQRIGAIVACAKGKVRTFQHFLSE